MCIFSLCVWSFFLTVILIAILNFTHIMHTLATVGEMTLFEVLELSDENHTPSSLGALVDVLMNGLIFSDMLYFLRFVCECVFLFSSHFYTHTHVCRNTHTHTHVYTHTHTHTHTQ